MLGYNHSQRINPYILLFIHLFASHNIKIVIFDYPLEFFMLNNWMRKYHRIAPIPLGFEEKVGSPVRPHELPGKPASMALVFATCTCFSEHFVHVLHNPVPSKPCEVPIFWIAFDLTAGRFLSFRRHLGQMRCLKSSQEEIGPEKWPRYSWLLYSKDGELI